MKKEQRLGYLILNEIETPLGECCLCTWCKFAEWSGDCEEADLDCKHPLWQVSEVLAEDAFSGDDCWGFRPKVSREDAVDVIGYHLQDKEVDWASVIRGGKDENRDNAL